MEKLKVQLPEPQLQSRTSTPTSVDPEAELERAVRKNVMGLPKRFAEKTLATFRGFADKVQTLRESIDSGAGAFVFGTAGVGKTHLAAGLAYHWYVSGIRVEPNQLTETPEIWRPKPPIFLPSVELFLELKKGFDKNQAEDDILRPYSQCGLLIIDDVGSERVSEWSRQVFYTLVDRRYREMRQTIITSNLSLDSLAKNIDERISSRIVEMGAVVRLDGKDHRLSRRTDA